MARKTIKIETHLYEAKWGRLPQGYAVWDFEIERSPGDTFTFRALYKREYVDACRKVRSQARRIVGATRILLLPGVWGVPS